MNINLGHVFYKTKKYALFFKLGVREPAQVRFKSLTDFMQQSLVNKNIKVFFKTGR